MKEWLRRLKAAVTLGGFWGAVSGVAAAACEVVVQLVAGGLAWDLVFQSALLYGVTGWIVGSAFAGTLISFEARGLLGRMRSWRIGLWGALMGGVLTPAVASLSAGPLSMIALAGLAGIGVMIGASLSAGTLRLAEQVSRELSAGQSAVPLGGDRLAELRPDDR